MRKFSVLYQISLGFLVFLLTLNSSASPSQAFSLQSLWEKLIESPPPVAVRRGGSRGEYFCPIAPEPGSKVWSDRPTLVWKGSVAQVQLVAADQTTQLWSQDITADQIASTAIESKNQAY
jgi:hypothetical protein